MAGAKRSSSTPAIGDISEYYRLKVFGRWSSAAAVTELVLLVDDGLGVADPMYAVAVLHDP